MLNYVIFRSHNLDSLQWLQGAINTLKKKEENRAWNSHSGRGKQCKQRDRIF